MTYIALAISCFALGYVLGVTMFEKEAEERAKDYTDNEKRQVAYEYGFLDGVDFGYNKANEWHYVKDGDLPKDNRYVLIATRTDVYRGFYENNNWYGDEGGRLRCIAWKELPELPKEIKEK